MKVTNHDGAADRRVLLGMIHDPVVLAAVAGKWEADGLFASTWANHVGKVCVRYYKKHGKAPKQHVHDLLFHSAQKIKDEDALQGIQTLLNQIEREGKQRDRPNAKFLIDLADERFNTARLENMLREVRDQLDLGNLAEAEAVRAAYRRVDIAAKAGVDFGLDQTVIDKLYEKDAETVVSYKGDIGLMLNPALVRGGFVAFLGGEKSTKSWWLMDTGCRAMVQGKKVAFFEVGDQTEIDLYGRLISRAAKAPFKVPRGGRDFYQFPTGIVPGETPTFEYEERPWPWPSRMPKRLAKAVYTKLSAGWEGVPRFKISTHPGHSINMLGVRGVLDGWARDGWLADAVVIDYSDLLAPLNGKLDKRDQINETWVSMRALSMERDVLVVTATQANRVGYGAEVLTKEHISDDKRKVGHVTALFGINRTPEEKGQGRCRINCIDARSFNYNPRTVVHVAGCLEIARPVILSSY